MTLRQCYFWLLFNELWVLLTPGDLRFATKYLDPSSSEHQEG
jgi:hypothetical protein